MLRRLITIRDPQVETSFFSVFTISIRIGTARLSVNGVPSSAAMVVDARQTDFCAYLSGIAGWSRPSMRVWDGGGQTRLQR
jgi:hypothetical protein